MSKNNFFLYQVKTRFTTGKKLRFLSNSYTGNIFSRRVGDFNAIGLPSYSDELKIPELLKEIHEYEMEYSGHFTIMIIKLHNQVLNKLLQETEITKLHYDLAGTFTFYIHPHLRFEALTSNDTGTGDSRIVKDNSVNKR